MSWSKHWDQVYCANDHFKKEQRRAIYNAAKLGICGKCMELPSLCTRLSVPLTPQDGAMSLGVHVGNIRWTCHHLRIYRGHQSCTKVLFRFSLAPWFTAICDLWYNIIIMYINNRNGGVNIFVRTNSLLYEKKKNIYIYIYGMPPPVQCF